MQHIHKVIQHSDLIISQWKTDDVNMNMNDYADRGQCVVLIHVLVHHNTSQCSVYAVTFHCCLNIDVFTQFTGERVEPSLRQLNLSLLCPAATCGRWGAGGDPYRCEPQLWIKLELEWDHAAAARSQFSSVVLCLLDNSSLRQSSAEVCTFVRNMYIRNVCLLCCRISRSNQFTLWVKYIHNRRKLKIKLRGMWNFQVFHHWKEANSGCFQSQTWPLISTVVKKKKSCKKNR